MCKAKPKRFSRAVWKDVQGLRLCYGVGVLAECGVAVGKIVLVRRTVAKSGPRVRELPAPVRFWPVAAVPEFVEHIDPAFGWPTDGPRRFATADAADAAGFRTRWHPKLGGPQVYPEIIVYGYIRHGRRRLRAEVRFSKLAFEKAARTLSLLFHEGYLPGGCVEIDVESRRDNVRNRDLYTLIVDKACEKGGRRCGDRRRL